METAADDIVYSSDPTEFVKKPTTRFIKCNGTIFCVWFTISFIACFIYALIAFLALRGKTLRLPEEVPLVMPYVNIPREYRLYLKFDIDYDKAVTTYSGSVEASFITREDTQRIYLHKGANLDIEKTELYSGTKKVSISKGAYSEEGELQSFVPSSNLTSSGEYRMLIRFSGRMEERGPKIFEYEEGGEKRYGVSFMQSRGAGTGLRYLFPCWDATDYPVRLSVRFERSAGLRLLTNWPIQEFRQISPTHMLDSFSSPSVVQPAKFAFVLCDMPYQRVNRDGIEISAYFRPSVLSSVSLSRVEQFMDDNSKQIGKLDVVVVASSPTRHQPGLSILDEEETVAENKELMQLANPPIG